MTPKSLPKSNKTHGGGLDSYQNIWRRPCKLPRHMEEAWLAARNGTKTHGGGLVSYQDICWRAW